MTASGVVRIRKDLDDPIEGKDVLLVEGDLRERVDPVLPHAQLPDA